MTKLRVVRHGSFKTMDTTSINEWINKEKCKMPSLPNLKNYIDLLIDANLVTLRDLSNAFRQVPLASADQKYLGYSIFGLKFMEKKQAYGIASAAANCQSFSQILIWILNNHKYQIQWRNKILVHIDDFVLAAKDEYSIKQMTKIFDELCDELNVKISVGKNIDFASEFELYGFYFDLKLKTVSIPDGKYRRIIIFLEEAIKFRWISGRALENLCGKLMHWSQLRGASKSLLINTVIFIHQRLRKVDNYKTTWFYLPDSIIRDLKFWLSFSKIIKTVPMEDIIRTPSVQIIGASDACDYGGGFVIGRDWAYYRFIKRHEVNWVIAQKEAHAVMMLIHNMKHLITGRKVILLVDNQTLFWAMKRHWTKGSLMPFVYELSLMQIKYKTWIWFEWIPTQYNVLADSLSRFDLVSFKKWVRLQHYNMRAYPYPLKYVRNFELYTP